MLVHNLCITVEVGLGLYRYLVLEPMHGEKHCSGDCHSGLVETGL